MERIEHPNTFLHRNRFTVAAALQPLAGTCLAIALIFRAVDLKAPAFLIGLTGAAFGIGFLPALYLSKFAHRRIGEKRAMMAGIAACAVISTPWTTYILSPWWLIPQGILFGASIALFWPALEESIGRSAPPGKLLRHLGNFNMAWCCAAAAGVLIGGVFYDIDPRLPFCFAAFVEILLFLHISTFRRPNHAVSHAEPHPDAAEVPSWQTRAYTYTAWAANSIMHMMVFGSRTLFPKIAMELHMRPAEVGAILSCATMATAIMFLILSLRHGWQFRKWFLFSMQAVGAIGLVLIAVADKPIYFAMAFSLLGLASGVTYYSSIYYSLASAGDRLAKSIIHEMVLSLGLVIGPVFFGIVASMAGDLRLPNNVGALLILVGIVLQAGILFRARRTAS